MPDEATVLDEMIDVGPTTHFIRSLQYQNLFWWPRFGELVDASFGAGEGPVPVSLEAA